MPLRQRIIKTFVNALRAVSIFNYRQAIARSYAMHHKSRPEFDWQREFQAVQPAPDAFKPFATRRDLKSAVVSSSISGITSRCYIPETLYYFEIEPKLNRLNMRLAYSDKCMYSRLLGCGRHYKLPNTIAYNINGFLYDENYRPTDDETLISLCDSRECIIKPSLDSGGGKNVVKCIQSNNRLIETKPQREGVVKFTDLLEQFDKDYVVQLFIEQHEYFRRLNPTSVNTMRFLTYR